MRKPQISQNSDLLDAVAEPAADDRICHNSDKIGALMIVSNVRSATRQTSCAKRVTAIRVALAYILIAEYKARAIMVRAGPVKLNYERSKRVFTYRASDRDSYHWPHCSDRGPKLLVVTPGRKRGLCRYIPPRASRRVATWSILTARFIFAREKVVFSEQSRYFYGIRRQNTVTISHPDCCYGLGSLRMFTWLGARFE